jgi:hypothetical protein
MPAAASAAASVARVSRRPPASASAMTALLRAYSFSSRPSRPARAMLSMIMRIRGAISRTIQRRSSAGTRWTVLRMKWVRTMARSSIVRSTSVCVASLVRSPTAHSDAT